MIDICRGQSRSIRQLPRYDLNEGPRLCFFEVTTACDLACRHCRACAQPQPEPGQLTTGQARQLIDQLTEFSDPPLLVLTGGDPFQRRDLFAIIDHAVSSGLEVSITPSATPLATADVLRRLRDAGVRRMAVSIDGADAATHDQFRGAPGSFERSLEMLVKAAGLGLSTQVNTTVTPHNVGQIDALADLLAELGIEMWSVFFLVPTGRAAVVPRLDAAECELVFDKLWRQSQRQPYVIKTTEAPHYRRFQMLRRSGNSSTNGQSASRPRALSLALNDGKGVMFVSSTGIIQPSGVLPIECGRFPTDHVVNIYRYSPVFCALRDVRRLEGKCGLCEFRRVCGGSRARAYAVTANMLAQEPDCNYVPAESR
jgi:radical SAM protein